jgi:hypothetical protein
MVVMGGALDVFRASASTLKHNPEFKLLKQASNVRENKVQVFGA